MDAAAQIIAQRKPMPTAAGEQKFGIGAISSTQRNAAAPALRDGLEESLAAFSG
jgi:hypothetical protein